MWRLICIHQLWPNDRRLGHASLSEKSDKISLSHTIFRATSFELAINSKLSNWFYKQSTNRYRSHRKIFAQLSVSFYCLWVRDKIWKTFSFFKCILTQLQKITEMNMISMNGHFLKQTKISGISGKTYPRPESHRHHSQANQCHNLGFL